MMYEHTMIRERMLSEFTLYARTFRWMMIYFIIIWLMIITKVLSLTSKSIIKM